MLLSLDLSLGYAVSRRTDTVVQTLFLPAVKWGQGNLVQVTVRLALFVPRVDHVVASLVWRGFVCSEQ